MIISGEYISHLTHSAQKEIEGFMDPRLACLTLGDAGIALILEESTRADIGFQEIDLFTLGKYSSLCIARITDRDEGEAIMLTDPIKQTEISIRQAVMHSQETLRKGNWEPESFQHIIMHQTSETAINDAVRAINKLYDREICTASNTVLNLGERGNTATTTHFVALHDFIMSNRINSGEKIVFAITGSGQTIGTALYTLDDLPDRMRNGLTSQMKKLDGKQNNDWAVRPPKKKGRIKIESVGLMPEGRPVDRNMVELAKSAAEDCLSHSFIHREDVNLLIYTGVYRNEFLSEPAVAALIAGALELNDDIRSTADKRTFAFDVFNSSLGFLNACHIAIQLIETEKHQNAMVVTAEIENNTHVYAARLRGLKETGSAIILDRDPEGKTGFGGFLFKQYDTYSEAIITHSEFDGGRTFLNIKVNPDFEAMYLKCIADCVMVLLREQELSIGDIALILPPQISPSFVDKLPETLGANKEKVINVAEAGFDYFGSSLPYSLAYIRMKNLATSGQAGLIINVGSGLQVGCAIYYF